ncbi:MAG: M67 family metallopeptidase [Anaerolineales bacterium]
MKSDAYPGISISSVTWRQMRDQVNHHLPAEACGLLAGLNDLATQIYPVTNILHSPVRYRMDPKEQLQAFQDIDDAGLELLAIYHSHPDGPDKPSPVDIAEAYYPQSVYLIWSLATGDWRCRGFKIEKGIASEIPLSILDGL